MEASSMRTSILITMEMMVTMISQCSSIGVNWGTRFSNELPPQKVVKMMKRNGFDKVKLFDCDDTKLRALGGSDVEVMLTIPNSLLDVMSNDPIAVVKWVASNITTYIQASVNIRYVVVGNEPFIQSYANEYANSTIRAVNYIQEALNNAGHGNIVKVTILFASDIVFSPNTNSIPSAGDFRPDIRGSVLEILDFLHQNGSPITINIHPYRSVYASDLFPIEYAFFDGSIEAIHDGDLVYTNVFDATYDTLVSALSKAGYPDMEIVVGEVGWPTDGDKHATVENAKRFNQGLLHHISDGQGTPLRRGANLDVFLFTLVDEDSMSITRGNFERHWGLFKFDGTPKYELDLSGSQRNVKLHSVEGVKHLPRRWCVLNATVKGLDDLKPTTMEYVCENTDCTALGYGCSCNHLTGEGNLSYAMNMIYQMKGQADYVCDDFHGLGMLTKKDPSVGSCEFPIMITSASVSLNNNFVLVIHICLTFWFFCMINNRILF